MFHCFNFTFKSFVWTFKDMDFFIITLIILMGKFFQKYQSFILSYFTCICNASCFKIVVLQWKCKNNVNLIINVHSPPIRIVCVIISMCWSNTGKNIVFSIFMYFDLHINKRRILPKIMVYLKSCVILILCSYVVPWAFKAWNCKRCWICSWNRLGQLSTFFNFSLFCFVAALNNGFNTSTLLDVFYAFNRQNSCSWTTLCWNRHKTKCPSRKVVSVRITFFSKLDIWNTSVYWCVYALSICFFVLFCYIFCLFL